MLPPDGWAPTGMGLTAASGDQTTLYGGSVFWDSVCACAPLAQYNLGVRIYGQIAYWRGTERPSDHEYLWEGSVTPTLVWMGPNVGAATLFTELGVGVSGLTETRLNTQRQFATPFSSTSTSVSASRSARSASTKWRPIFGHVSNGSIKQENDGNYVLRRRVPVQVRVIRGPGDARSSPAAMHEKAPPKRGF